MASLDRPRWREAASADRLLLAFKTAGAAALAWYLAPLVPFAQNEYSYYAPLGVLVSMYPTIARSAFSGLQTLIGLAVGIGLGLGAQALVGAGMPRIIAVAAVVGLGVLLAGLRSLGSGREWVAIAGLFVLLLGGADPDGYSSSYLITVAFGVLVGVVVNLVVIPPLHLRQAEDRLVALRAGLGDALREMADALAGYAFDPEPARAAARRLADALADVREEVELADESRRYNPRGRRSSLPRDAHQRRLEALAVAAEATRELTAAVAELTEADDVDERLPTDVRHSLATTIRAVAGMVSDRAGTDTAALRLDDADAALDDYVVRVSRMGVEKSEDRAVTLDRWDAGVILRRVIDACRPLAERAEDRPRG
ncbi:FUSC family protein [Microbacterium proteolyticum]|uniref:FUSC family protein n=1 Tax=Microbacterium proteolyticum TaxID=1572644 RepID=UPI0035C1F8C1